MVNTEPRDVDGFVKFYYNILNIVVNTEPNPPSWQERKYYNILNIVVNTEPTPLALMLSKIITY